jgi:energy-coupling factor transporter ATP-binding protein EcfA2
MVSPVEALREVSLAIEHGELVSIVGPSGSGKTTLLHVTGALLRPSSDMVRIAGTATSSLTDRALSSLRAYGATRRHIAIQFTAEALILSALGGAGLLAGVLITAGVAHVRHWSTAIPPVLFPGALAAALTFGPIAGLYPAVRAARLSPTDALRGTT